MVLNKFEKIKHFIFDVDGVFTNSQLLITEEGHLLRSMNTRDGYAVKKAIAKGYTVCVITGGSSIGVGKRLTKLGITEIYTSVENKAEVFEELINKYGWQTNEVLYMGDDLPDFEAMKLAGCKCAPRDADEAILSISDFISTKAGGKGCVREVIEKVLKLQQSWI